MKTKQIIIGRLNKNVPSYSLPGGRLQFNSEPEECVKQVISEELGIEEIKCKRFKVLNRFDANQKYHYILIVLIADVGPNPILKKRNEDSVNWLWVDQHGMLELDKKQYLSSDLKALTKKKTTRFLAKIFKKPWKSF